MEHNLIINPAVSVIADGADGYAAQYLNMRFIVSVGVEQDGKKWLHVSASKDGGKMPTYDDLKTLKKLCVGDHKTAIQVFPPASKHIDIASKFGTEVLHLWSCLDDDNILPDFTRGGDTI